MASAVEFLVTVTHCLYMQFDLSASNMFQIHGKTRRGRPPKYQQYWISLAMEKAAQRALENEKTQNSEAVNAGSEKPALKDDSSTTKDARLQQQENTAANRTEEKNSDQPQLKRRSNSWPLNENGKDGLDGSTSPLYVHKLLIRNNSSNGMESREDFQIVKKLKPNDVPSSDHFKSSSALNSTWNDKLFACDVPFLVAAPYKQVTKGVVVQTSNPKSPEGQHGPSQGRNFFPGMILNSTGFGKTDSYSGDRRGSFYDTLPDNGHVQQFATMEKSEYALDLSSKLLSTESNEDNVSTECVSVEKPAQLNVALENRQLLNVVQPWSTGQPPEEIQAWNAEKMSSKQEHNGCSAQPMLRAVPYSRLAEVSMWTVDEVVQFVSMIPGCHEYAECFREEDIDGSSLLQLSESHLRNIIRMKLGPSLHLKKALDDLATFGSNAAA